MNEQKLLRSFEEFEYDVVTEVVSPERLEEDTHGREIKIPAVKKTIMKGIIQKADVLNQNGRIYPRHILEREVRNYQKFIQERRALGECVPPGTEIYTRDGWKNIEDIAEDEVIATLDVEKNKLQFNKINKKVDIPYVGKMHRFVHASGEFDFTVTPDHKVLAWHTNGTPYKVSSEELSKRPRELNGSKIKSIESECVVDFSLVSVETFSYDGRVYCVNVKNNTWLMRQNGKACWTGNCDHPESSVVNLKNVSHLITEAYMDDKGVVYGTLEVLSTPSGQILQSLVDSKVKIGISSRGVGSTKKQGDYQVVQDDFMIVTWDVVSEPSTSGAFVIPEGKIVTSEELKRLFNKSDRIDRILNDILSFRK